ncbi:MAG TPA: enoyl-CoA hydratase-related protein [Candidatus Saccharimonadales bacterium]|nr:enoyl-CoA hydratase-related protein [Candidatus Saccharimonadales bacterium]
MSYKNLLYENDNGVARITVNRPEKLNALNRETVRELDEAMSVFLGDASAGALILTGSGSRAFVAGADIGELSTQTPLEAQEYARHGQSVLARIERSRKPTIAAVNGFALGGGLELAMACQIRVAAEGAALGLPEVSLGLIPGFGGTQRLPRLVGRGMALEMILTGGKIDAQEALRVGLVNRVVPADQLLESCLKMARTILSRGPAAVSLAIDAVNRGLEMPQEEAMHLEAGLFGIAASTEDAKEGTRAFLEKRKASFQGR